MNIVEVLSVLILLSCFILIANKRAKAYIKTFRLQSALIAVSAFYMGMENMNTIKGIDLFVIGVVIIILKVYLIPRILKKTSSEVEYKVEKGFFYNIPFHVLVSCAIVVFLYFSISTVDGINKGEINVYLVNSISVVMIGFFFMISRKKAIGQIVGFLVIENGLFVTAMFSTHGMPIVVDLGIFIDLITAVLIMGIMVFKINEHFESIDINKLKNLRG